MRGFHELGLLNQYRDCHLPMTGLLTVIKNWEPLVLRPALAIDSK